MRIRDSSRASLVMFWRVILSYMSGHASWLDPEHGDPTQLDPI